MPITAFPDPREAIGEDVIAIGGDLHPDSLLLAYRSGIFPWPDPSFPKMIWSCPQMRGVLFFKDLRIPKSLQKSLKKMNYRVSLNEDFAHVIRICAKIPRADASGNTGPGTWITSQMIKAYERLHALGYAHSVEVWNADGKLAGGLYGVFIDGVFAGESMFHFEPNTSKVALLFLIKLLATQGLEWIDIQMVTPHMEKLGACEISREDFLELLKASAVSGKMLSAMLSI